MREHLLICAILIFAQSIAASAEPYCAYPGWPEDRQSLRDQVVYFESGRVALNAEAKHKVAEVGKYLKAHPSTAVAIEGHCDDRGTEEHNRRLGEKRALALRKELIRTGVDPNRIDTMSYGEDRPADPGHNKEGRRKNRRAEFVLLRPPK